MAKLRIGVLHDYWWGDDEERNAGQRPKRKPPSVDITEVYDALKENGHSPVYLRLDGTAESLRELAEAETDLIFNLVESFAGNDTQDHNIAGYLELLGRRFTGSGSRGLTLAQDKALAKKIFAFHGIKTPEFASVFRGRSDHAHDLAFPVIVKPAAEDGSIGIHFEAVCNSIKELMERIDYIHSEFDSPALIEEYIDGRELYVAVLGNERPEALPVIELDLSKLPKGTPRIAGAEVKWEEGTAAYEKTKNVFPKDLDAETLGRLQQTAVLAYQALRLQDYGRIDFRLGKDGTAYVIEVNPNPYLLSTAELALSAKEAGKSYAEVIESIVGAALARYGASPSTNP
jgi:D-alanine-D-alanine ligase